MATMASRLISSPAARQICKAYPPGTTTKLSMKMDKISFPLTTKVAEKGRMVLNVGNKKEKIFNPMRIKANNKDDGQGEGDGEGKEPRWLQKLVEFTERHKRLSQVVSYIELVTAILNAMWMAYKFILKPGYQLGKEYLKELKKLRKPETEIVVAADAADEGDKDREEKKKAADEGDKDREEKKKGEKGDADGNTNKTSGEKKEGVTINPGTIMFVNCVFYIYIKQVNFYIGSNNRNNNIQ